MSHSYHLCVCLRNLKSLPAQYPHAYMILRLSHGLLSHPRSLPSYTLFLFHRMTLAKVIPQCQPVRPSAHSHAIAPPARAPGLGLGPSPVHRVCVRRRAAHVLRLRGRPGGAGGAACQGGGDRRRAGTDQGRCARPQLAPETQGGTYAVRRAPCAVRRAPALRPRRPRATSTPRRRRAALWTTSAHTHALDGLSLYVL